MIKVYKFASCCVLLIASPATGGEIGGNGRVTPIEARGVAASECAYSGLNDEYILLGIDDRVQSYGQIVRAFGGIPPFVPSPGVACRG